MRRRFDVSIRFENLNIPEEEFIEKLDFELAAMRAEILAKRRDILIEGDEE